MIIIFTEQKASWNADGQNVLRMLITPSNETATGYSSEPV
jgi:hypothetical protein